MLPQNNFVIWSKSGICSNTNFSFNWVFNDIKKYLLSSLSRKARTPFFKEGGGSPCNSLQWEKEIFKMYHTLGFKRNLLSKMKEYKVRTNSISPRKIFIINIFIIKISNSKVVGFHSSSRFIFHLYGLKAQRHGR